MCHADTLICWRKSTSRLLPRTELGILQALGQEERLFAGDIAAELDVSPQLVGWRGKKLAERQLVERRMVKGRREFKATDMARRVYFSNPDVGELQVGQD
jgi:Mn-dependent DtxR family transcriptional regulator